MQYDMQQTEHIPINPPHVGGGGSTTTSNHPSTPSTRVYYSVSAIRMKTKNDDDQSEMARKFTVILCLVSQFKSSATFHANSCNSHMTFDVAFQVNVGKTISILQRFFTAIIHYNKYLIITYEVSCMLIFDVEFKGHPRSAVQTFKVVPHLKMFIKPLRCNKEKIMFL